MGSTNYKYVGLSKAMQIAAGEPAADLREEMGAIDMLFGAYKFARTSQHKVEGLTAGQLQMAVEDIAKRQDHSPMFQSAASDIAEHLSGQSFADNATSKFLGSVAHWSKLNIEQRMKVCKNFVEYTGAVINRSFPGERALQFSARSMIQPPVPSYNARTGRQEIVSPPLWVNDKGRGTYEFHINIDNRSSFTKPVATLQEIVKVSFDILQQELARDYLLLKTNISDQRRAIAPDAERLAELHRINAGEIEYSFGADVIVSSRFSDRHAKDFGSLLAALVNHHRDELPVPKKSVMQKVLSL